MRVVVLAWVALGAVGCKKTEPPVERAVAARPAAPVYDWTSDLPVIVPVNDAAPDDLVGFFQRETPSETMTGGTERLVGAIDAATLQPIWTRPAGGEANNLRVAAGRLLYTSFPAAANLLDVRTGALVATVELSARPATVCSPLEQGTEVWIATHDGERTLVDLKTGAARPAPDRPAWCDAIAVPRPELSDVPKVRSFAPDGIVSLGDLRLALGQNLRTDERMMVAYAPEGERAVAWQRSFASLHGLVVAGDRVVASTRDAGTTLVALDARTGEEVWRRTPFPPGPMKFADDRIYVQARRALQVLDARTGATLGAFGRVD